MENDIRRIEEALRGTPLAGRNSIALPVPEWPDPAFAIEIAEGEIMEAWEVLRDRVEMTGRWPVVAACWNDGADWESQVSGAGLFSRFEYEHEPGCEGPRDASPQAVLARADSVDLGDFLAKLAGNEEPVGDDWEYELGDTEERLGVAPSAEDVANASVGGVRPRTIAEFQRWLYDWEIAAVGVERALEPDRPNHLGWEDMGVPYALVLPPTGYGWEALAFMHWFGAGATGTPPMVALLRSWNERFGAELVAHLGTMLYFHVRRPPSDPGETFQVAREQEAVAPCTTCLPGVSLRTHARNVRNSERWFLHERP